MSAYSAYIASKRQSAKKNDRFLLHKKKIPRVMNCPQKKNSKIASEVNLNVESLPSESTLEQLKEVSKPNVSSEFTDSESKQEISDLQSVRPLFQETEILIDVQPMEVISEDLTNNQPQHPSKLSEGFVESGLPTKKSNLSDIEKGKGGIQNLQLGGPQNIISWCPSETCLCEIITGGVCITLYYLQHVSIIGSCILQVLHGCVIVDGYMLSCDGTLPVISSKSASLVTIKGWRNDRLNLTNETLLLKKDFLEVPLLNKVSELCKQNNDSNISVLLIKNSNFSIKEHLFDFSEVSSSFDFEVRHNFPELSNSQFTFQLVPPIVELPPNIMTNQQEAVIENLRTPPNDSCPPIVLLLGARNSGKSTFSRFFVNRMLRSHQAVMYLDCDLGQSEFMPPGFLSLTKRSVPIFGTPCCHLQKPEKAYFIGDTTCQRDPHYYLLCIKELYQLYNGKYSNFPLIVNTHGWLVGLGLMIIECICTIVNPSDIVLLAITEKEFTEKFSTLLNAKADYFGVVKERKRSFSKVTVTNIHAVEGYKRKRKSKTLKYKASFHRLMSLAVYFACCTPICFQAPYEVSLDDVQVELLYDVVAKTQHLCAINGNFVGLCVADKPGPKRPLECLGLAIVRAVDVGNRKLYINTPLDARELERVNVLQKGVIEIPIVMRTQGAYGHVPYTQQPVYSGSKGRRSVNRHIMGSGKKVNRLVKRKRLMRSR